MEEPHRILWEGCLLNRKGNINYRLCLNRGLEIIIVRLIHRKEIKLQGFQGCIDNILID